MHRTVLALALLVVAGCDRGSPVPAAPPPTDEKPSVELKLDAENGAVEFKKDDGDGGDVDVEIKTE